MSIGQHLDPSKVAQQPRPWWRLRVATAPAAFDVDEVQQAADTGGCDSCGGLAAFVLTYPDVKFRLCGGCLGPDVAHLAEPLDLDDQLSTDPRPVLERQDPRW
jgi:hypothetical protein